MVTPQPAPVERRSRDMARNAVAVKRQPSPALTAARRAASPAPTQQEFNTALSQRASSLGQGAKLPVSVRNSQTRTVVSIGAVFVLMLSGSQKFFCNTNCCSSGLQTYHPYSSKSIGSCSRPSYCNQIPDNGIWLSCSSGGFNISCTVLLKLGI